MYWSFHTSEHWISLGILLSGGVVANHVGLFDLRGQGFKWGAGSPVLETRSDSSSGQILAFLCVHTFRPCGPCL